MYVDLAIPPGQVRVGTDMQSAGRWRDCNLIRWREGAMQPVGGWRDGVDLASGIYRGSISWRDNSGDRWIAAGSHDTLQAVSDGGTVYDITPSGLTSGNVDATMNTGYGGGVYGAGTYGTPRVGTGSYSEATTWALDTWGEYLLACSPDDGGIYEWDLDTGGIADPVSNAPTDCLGLVVTAERFVFALGADGDPRQVAWCDREDNTTWTPAATNEAGDIRLEIQGQIMCGYTVPGQTLILTDQEAFRAEYVGPPFVYGFDKVGSGCGIVSRKACARANNGAIWMGRSGFYAYFGGGVEPIPCDVADYVFSDLNYAQASKIAAVPVKAFDEVWWFYPSGGSNECDRYVSYNYRDGIWMTGELARTTGFDAGVFDYPVLIGVDAVAYDHEVGPVVGATPYAESGPIRMGAGNNVFTATRFIPDELTQGSVQMRFKARKYPNADEREEGPFSAGEPTNIRITGRQIRLRVEAASESNWRWGVPSIMVQQRGRR